jgi:hypothetical protein
VIKTFCDCCGDQIERNYTTTRMTGETIIRNKRIKFEVIAGIGDAFNTGDPCKHCLYAALDIYDDRPKAHP